MSQSPPPDPEYRSGSKDRGSRDFPGLPLSLSEDTKTPMTPVLVTVGPQCAGLMPYIRQQCPPGALREFALHSAAGIYEQVLWFNSTLLLATEY